MPATSLAQQLVTGAQSLLRADVERTPDAGGGENAIYGELKSWAQRHAVALQLDPGKRIEVRGFHATYRVAPTGRLVVEVVAQFLQMRKTVGELAFGGLPFRGGTTVIAGADGRVRFVIAKPMDAYREGRQQAFVREHDRIDPAGPWADESYLGRRAVREFRRLHEGLLT